MTKKFLEILIINISEKCIIYITLLPLQSSVITHNIHKMQSLKTGFEHVSFNRYTRCPAHGEDRDI